MTINVLPVWKNTHGYDTVPVKGSPVTCGTLWSLEGRGLCRTYGWFSSGKGDLKLTPFGKQIIEWIGDEP